MDGNAISVEIDGDAISFEYHRRGGRGGPISLSDPLTLQETVRNTRILARPNEEAVPCHCDPYSFFRQLREEGEAE